MASLTPVQRAAQGQQLIESAIIDVLQSRKSAGYGMGAAEISRLAEIFRSSGNGDPIKGMNDAIVTGFLIKLFNDGKICRKLQKNGLGGWMVV